jgi:SAM-dependent methyltransferase
MTPDEVGRSYDAIAQHWRAPVRPLTGLPQHRHALQFLKSRGHALDVGCGCNGRLIDLLRAEGFAVTGLDVSEQMIALAKERAPDVEFVRADIRQWDLPRVYDLITAWDSVWHVPLADQELVLRKLCCGLNQGGVMIFTLGGTDEPGEVRDAPMGVPMYTATLGVPKTLALLAECRCVCRHFEFDQHPELHAYVVAQQV